MKKIRIILSAIFIALLCIIALQAAYSQTTTQKSLSVTVYNSDLGVVKDVREIDIKSGVSELKITDVAERIDPTSVHIKLKGNVLEQDYRYDLVSVDKVLRRYIDKEIMLISDKNVIEGTLLSIIYGSIVIKQKSGGLIMLPKYEDYRVAVGELPEGLITKPTLVWTVDSKSAGRQEVELSYQTSGMKWHAEYVAVLGSDDKTMDLNAWVSIENNSGATYKDAGLKLVAGDVHRVEGPQMGLYSKGRYALSADKSMEQFEEKAFFEYHIYNLQRPATIANNEIKQISLFEVENVKISKKYTVDGQLYGFGKVPVRVKVEFENKKQNNLGMPIPQGKVRIYKSDGKNLEFIGEDMVDHTPKDEKISLNVGEAFDIVAETKATETKRISNKVSEETFQVTVRNKKNEDILVEYYLNHPYNEEIISSSMNYEKKDVYSYLFKIPVKSDGEAVLEYKVRYVD